MAGGVRSHAGCEGGALSKKDKALTTKKASKGATDAI